MLLKCDSLPPPLLLLLLGCFMVMAAPLQQPTLAVYPGYQMRLDLKSSSISLNPTTNVYSLRAYVEIDNADLNVPPGFRRWWHFEVSGLSGCPSGCTIAVELIGAMYDEAILPVWSLDGKDYERCPSSSLPTYSGGVHRFTLAVPAGTSSFRIAKFFPYPIPTFEEFRKRVLGSSLVVERQVGESELGYPMYLWEIATAKTLAQEGIPRIYIHAGIHPSETTSYFVDEGFLNWLLFSDSPEAAELLERAVISVIPLCNPDGVSLGNYRTNAKSVNLENEYGFPYTSTVKESAAIIKTIEEYMGNASNPGAHPIKVLMNLHSTHAVAYPFHFLHQPYYWANKTGVIPEVRELENTWDRIFRNRSTFLSLGTPQYSTFSTREYVESMMHDRWTLDPQYPAPITMAITMEGVYQNSPRVGCCGTQEDYRTMGVELGLALLDYIRLPLGDKSEKLKASL